PGHVWNSLSRESRFLLATQGQAFHSLIRSTTTRQCVSLKRRNYFGKLIHIFTVVSRLAEANIFPSFRNATVVTGRLCTQKATLVSWRSLLSVMRSACLETL